MSSFCIMVLELVAARLIARILGSSLYTWTAVIGVVLAGITLGNYLGGRIADRYPARKTLAGLFALCSLACILTVVTNNLVGVWRLLWYFSMPLRVFAHVALVFLPPSLLLGAISPVVAKMALEKGLATGRTVGSIYAAGAAGSIAGTFAAGYYLIAALGSVAIVWALAIALLIIGMLYLFRFWVIYVSTLMLAAGLLMGLGPWQWAEKAGARIALRDTPDPDVIYEDESQYSYIAVNRLRGRVDIRDFVQDKLMHSRVNMDDILDLRYFYTRIYAKVTKTVAAEKDKLKIMVIGGGGYVYPRYVEKVWPGSTIEVVEIDPAVTKAAIEAFGLDPDTSIKTIQMDARNYIDELAARNRTGQIEQPYDLIYEDAINDYFVPFQLTTIEFNEKIAKLLADDGVYMINLIDVFDDGFFLAAIINTLEQTFPHVSVMTEAGVPRAHRNTFVVIASRRQIDLESLYAQAKKEGTIFHLLREDDLRYLRDKNKGLVLTDNYVPVENLLAPVVRRKSAQDLAEDYLRQARKFLENKEYEKSVAKYKQVLRRAPSMAIKAYNNMAVALIKLDRWSEAADSLYNALEAIRQEDMEMYTGNIHYNLAVVLSRMGKREQAHEHFEKAIADFKEELIPRPKDSELYLKIGKSLASMARLKEAEEYLRKALDLNPSNLPHHLEMARNLEVQQRYDEAIDLLQESVRYMLNHGRKDEASLLVNYIESIKTRKDRQEQSPSQPGQK
jgi:spermidine synthase/Tfp pilus assembly protein PilF